MISVWGMLGDAVNRDAQITSVLILGFAVVFLGWVVVYLASAPIHPYEEDASRPRFLAGRNEASIAERPRMNM